MSMERLLEKHAFTPREKVLLTTAFIATLQELRLSEGSDVVREVVAGKIIELALEGEREPERLRAKTIGALVRN
jgi:hypothetical protein